ncbi:MAG: hypothetical protein PPP58_11825 [Natronomonas sp.]
MDDERDFEFQVESRLTSHGVYVDTVAETEAGYRVEYESISADKGVVPHREVGRVINVFLDLHDDDWRGAELEGVATDLDGNEQGRWHVEQEWLAALQEEELTETEFSEKVIDSIETVDQGE